MANSLRQRHKNRGIIQHSDRDKLGVIVNYRDHGVIQADGVGVALLDTGVLVNPAEHLLVPHQTVLLLGHPTLEN